MAITDAENLPACINLFFRSGCFLSPWYYTSGLISILIMKGFSLTSHKNEWTSRGQALVLVTVAHVVQEKAGDRGQVLLGGGLNTETYDMILMHLVLYHVQLKIILRSISSENRAHWQWWFVGFFLIELSIRWYFKCPPWIPLKKQAFNLLQQQYLEKCMFLKCHLLYWIKPYWCQERILLGCNRNLQLFSISFLFTSF